LFLREYITGNVANCITCDFFLHVHTLELTTRIYRLYELVGVWASPNTIHMHAQRRQ